MYRMSAMACAFLMVACIDDSFRLDEVSKEVTLGQESTTTLPIGFLDKMCLGDMIDTEDIKGLTIDENGNYAISYAQEPKSIEIEGVTTSFDIPRTSTSFMVTYPSFDIETAPVELHESPTVAMDIDQYNIGGNQYYVPDDISIPIEGEFHNTCALENLHFDVPQQISEIRYILLEGGEYGAPIQATLDFNSLKDINGGGKINFNLNLSGATFTLRDENGELCTGNSFEREYDFGDGEESVTFEVFVEKIDGISEIENGELDIPIEVEYDLAFEMDAKSGTFTADSMPTLSFDAVLDYKDADVELDNHTPIIEYHEKSGSIINISGLPEEIESISKISLADDMIVTLYAHGLEWLEQMGDLVELEVILPSYLTLHNIPGVDYSYDEDNHLLKTTLAELSQGMDIGIDAIDFANEKIVPENGKIEINFAPDIVAHFADHAEVLVSSLLENGGSEIEFETGMEEATLKVESVSGEIAYCYEYNDKIEITGIDSDLDIEIEGSGLSPVITINLSNPLTMTADVKAQLTPKRDNIAIEDNTLTISDVDLTPATYVDGEIVNGETCLILADEARRGEFADERYTFVACDIDELFCGKLPDELDLRMELSTDGDVTSEIYIAENSSFVYSYDINVPIAFNRDLDVKYADRVDGLADTFDELAEYDIKVGDITIIADIANTTPLAFNGSAEFIDKDGAPAEIKMVLPEEGIHIDGSEDGVSEVHTLVRFGFDIPGSDIRTLKDIDGIDFTLYANGVSEDNVPLSDKQYVSATLKLELAGGITVDLDSLTK